MDSFAVAPRNLRSGSVVSVRVKATVARVTKRPISSSTKKPVLEENNKDKKFKGTMGTQKPVIKVIHRCHPSTLLFLVTFHWVVIDCVTF